ncbi:MAG TPA: glycerophosphodiester phosphodiesterase [Usitatibacter sp.]|nr:glycerophosphodiester phosphodiesterase [Usitatibacter sp.]
MKRPWPYPRVVAHRGGGRHAPENTLAAIRLGQSLGYRCHELDVKLSRDGVALLMHDATLERTTNGHGRAADLSWSELQALDAGAWHSEPFRGERIPAFEAAAAALRERGTMAHIEIKPTPGFDRATGEHVARETQRLWKGAGVPPVFSSFSYEALMAAKAVAPEIPRGWLIDQFTEADWDRLAALDATSLHANHRKFDVAWVNPLHDAGYRIMLYTVNDVDRAKALLAAGVDGVFTDELEAFVAPFGAEI